MKLIGIDLYQHLLESSIRAARGEDVERWSPEINVGMEGRIPANWVPDEELRVSLYCRLARMNDEEEVQAFGDELEDRFGAIPSDVDTLLRIARIRVAARAARIARIDAGPAAIALTRRRDFASDARRLGLQEKNDRLLLSERIAEPAERLARIEVLLQALADQ